MAVWVEKEGAFREPDPNRVDEAAARSLHPFAKPAGDINGIRERLSALMWDGVGIMREKDRLEGAVAALDELGAELEETGVADRSRAFNLAWHDWLDLVSLILISKVIARAALRREESRGAHYREDFPETGDLDQSRYTVARLKGKDLDITMEPVDFSIVRPGESLIEDEAIEDEAGAPPKV